MSAGLAQAVQPPLQRNTSFGRSARFRSARPSSAPFSRSHGGPAGADPLPRLPRPRRLSRACAASRGSCRAPPAAPARRPPPPTGPGTPPPRGTWGLRRRRGAGTARGGRRRLKLYLYDRTYKLDQLPTGDSPRPGVGVDCDYNCKHIDTYKYKHSVTVEFHTIIYFLQ